MSRPFIKDLYVYFISLVIGITIFIALYDQIQTLGAEVLSTELKNPYRSGSVRGQRNLTNLLLFLTISISGICYGIVGIYKVFKSRDEQKENTS